MKSTSWNTLKSICMMIYYHFPKALPPQPPTPIWKMVCIEVAILATLRINVLTLFMCPNNRKVTFFGSTRLINRWTIILVGWGETRRGESIQNMITILHGCRFQGFLVSGVEKWCSFYNQNDLFVQKNCIQKFFFAIPLFF